MTVLFRSNNRNRFVAENADGTNNDLRSERPLRLIALLSATNPIQVIFAGDPVFVPAKVEEPMNHGAAG